ncbi:MAG: hydrogenase subunit MbhD domain-containing protein [Marinilabiliaceae bacterium]
MSFLIDSILAILLIYLALQCLLAPRLTQTVFVFFAFGLALALAWVRLGAVDVAITEAAIASGFLGVLFLDALSDFSFTASDKQENSDAAHNSLSGKTPKSLLLPRVVLVLGLALFLLIALEAVWKIPEGGGLTAATEARLPESGVENPVTAVLLNFRAYDTWLEMGVILLGLLAIFAVGGTKLYPMPNKVVKDPIMRQAILFFIPVLFLFGAFLLYFGKSGPGGAFQAGILWGAIGILLHLGGRPVISMMPRWLRQLLLTMGLGFFLILGFLLLAGGAALFEYPPAYAGVLILTIETLAAISIAVALTAMFAHLNQVKKKESNEIEPTN